MNAAVMSSSSKNNNNHDFTTSTAAASLTTLNNNRSSSTDYVDLGERLTVLEKRLTDPFSDLFIERLLDAVIAASKDLENLAKNNLKSDQFKKFLERFLDIVSDLELSRRRLTDFTELGTLGSGAFGKVKLVRDSANGQVCAMKVLNKCRMLDQHADCWAEREIMARGGADSPWIVQLYYAFQDPSSLYLVMEFVPGGTLISRMVELDLLSEVTCRFYAAETALALAALHSMGYIHRDLKPDNLLLDAGGHVKLADFGTAVRVDPHSQLFHAQAAVGTPDYLSPEVLLSQGAGGGSYGFEVDWWALGVVVYEMLFGDTPFYAESLVNTYAKIMGHESSLKFPDDIPVSLEGRSFMKQLLCDRSKRLGTGRGFTLICNHPWFSPDWAVQESQAGHLSQVEQSFADWTWPTIRACRAPFVPQLDGEADVTYFRGELNLGGSTSSSTESSEEHKQQPSGGDKLEGSREEEDMHDSDETEGGDGRHPPLPSPSEIFGFNLAFAGFSFLSPQNNRPALFSRPPKTPRRSLSSRHRSTSLGISTIEQQGKDALVDGVVLADDDLQAKLTAAETRCTELEALLGQSQADIHLQLVEAERRAEATRSEVKAERETLELELANWKSTAQSEQRARQTAEASTEELLKRAAAVADRSITSTTTTTASNASHHLPPRSFTQDNLQSSQTTTSQQQQQQLLLTRVEEMAKRARLAEASVREMEEQLEAEQRFSRLYKQRDEDKSEEVDSLKHQLQQVQGQLQLIRTSAQRAHEECEAARRALVEEQHRSIRYRDRLEISEDHLAEASSRVSSAKAEAVCHAKVAEELRHALTMEKAKNVALIDKLHQVLSGECPQALDLMMGSEDISGGFASSSVSPRSFVSNQRQRSQRQQQQQSRLAKQENKRLHAENERMARENAQLYTKLGNLQSMIYTVSSPRTSPRDTDDSDIHNGSSLLVHQYQPTSNNNPPSTTLPLAQDENGFVHLRSRSAATQNHLSVWDHPVVRTGGQVKSTAGAGSSSARSNITNQLSPPTQASQVVVGTTSFVPSPHQFSVRTGSTVTNGDGGGPLDRSTLNGQLLMMVKQSGGAGRKKYSWQMRFVRLTSTHLIASPVALDVSEPLECTGGEHQQPPSSPHDLTPTRTPSARRRALNGFLKLPLSALFHVRKVGKCDLLHEQPNVLSRAFQIIYDEAFTDHLGQLDEEWSLTLRRNNNPPNSAGSMTLPRKFSWGSSALHSTGLQSGGPGGTLRPLSPAALNSNSKKKPGLVRTNSSAASSSSSSFASTSLNAGSNRVIDESSGQNGVILVKGHKFQRIQFRTMATCDLCLQACWNVLRPPLALQCSRCQIKLHLHHLTVPNDDTQVQPLRYCGKAVLLAFFQADDSEERDLWIKRVSSAIAFFKQSGGQFQTPPPPPHHNSGGGAGPTLINMNEMSNGGHSDGSSSTTSEVSSDHRAKTVDRSARDSDTTTTTPNNSNMNRGDTYQPALGSTSILANLRPIALAAEEEDDVDDDDDDDVFQ